MRVGWLLGSLIYVFALAAVAYVVARAPLELTTYRPLLRTRRHTGQDVPVDEPVPDERPISITSAVAFLRVGDDPPQTIGHADYIVVQLHLFTVEEGGQGRHLQSGFRASWMAEGIPHAMRGPIVFAEGDRRSMGPGEDAVVHVHPELPVAWAEVQPGMRLSLCKHAPRALGEGHVIEQVRVDP